MQTDNVLALEKALQTGAAKCGEYRFKGSGHTLVGCSFELPEGLDFRLDLCRGEVLALELPTRGPARIASDLSLGKL